MMGPVLSIIIVNWNAGDVIGNCLKSIYGTVKKPFEIIVVDNKSSDDSVSTIMDKFPDVKLLKESKNIGFSKANNAGFRSSSGKYVLFLNPDTVLFDRAIDDMLSFLENHSKVGIIGPKIFDACGNISKHGKGRLPSIFEDVLSAFLIRRFLDWIEGVLIKFAFFRKMIYSYYEVSGECECLSGCCLLLAREFFDDLGGFDETIPMYLDDIDMCFRAREKGKSNYYLAEALITHLEQHSTKKSPDYKMHGLFAMQAKLLYYKKHFSGGRVLVYRLVVMASIPYLLILDIITSPYFILTGRFKEMITIAKKHLKYAEILIAQGDGRA